MRIDIHHHFESRACSDPAIQKLDQILATLTQLISEHTHMSAELDTLVEKVTAIESVGDSAIELLVGLKQKLDEALVADDREALIALSERLGAQTQELADAIAANTPA